MKFSKDTQGLILELAGSQQARRNNIHIGKSEARRERSEPCHMTNFAVSPSSMLWITVEFDRL